MSRVVLVTGVSRDLGSRFARQIAGAPQVDRVIGVDVQPPRGDMGAVQFVRADIRNPVIAKVIVRDYCAEIGVPYHETGLISSYREALRHMHHVGAPLRTTDRHPVAG